MKQYYKGSRPCPACGNVHSEKCQRFHVDDICFECKRIMNLGRISDESNKNESNEYVNVCFYRPNLYEESFWNVFIELLKYLNRPDKSSIAKNEYNGNHSFNSYTGTYDSKTYEILKKMKELIYTSQNDVYKKGFTNGSSVLMQLHDGTISMDDFNRRIKNQQ